MDIYKTGRIMNWREICRNRKEWKKAVQEVHLGLRSAKKKKYRSMVDM